MMRTLWDSIDEFAATRGGHPALIADDRVVSYAELRDRVAAVAAELAGRGLPRGARIGVETFDPIEHFIGAAATMAAGMVATAVPNDSAESYAAVCTAASPPLVLGSGTPSFAPPAVSDRVTIQELAGHGHGTNFSPARPQPEEIAMIYYTSGTTSGLRKGVLQSYRALAATADYISRVMRLDPSVVEYVASPVDNAFWFGRCRVLMHVGGTALLATGSLNPLKILSTLKQHGGNCLAGDTPVFAMLLHNLKTKLGALGPQLKWAKIASQAMVIDDKRALLALLPNARIVMNYGLTEAMRCCLLPWEDYPDKIESVGRPSPGVVARIVSDSGQVLEATEIGEIQVCGPNTASGYLNQEELWKSRYVDGWYATGDLGWIDAEGFVYIGGRRDDAINVGGRTVAPLEVEQAIRPLLPGRRLAAFGVPDPRGILGEVVAIAIEGKWEGEHSWNDFRAGLLGHMPAALVPDRAYAMSVLPQTGNGKVQRAELARRARDGELELI